MSLDEEFAVFQEGVFSTIMACVRSSSAISNADISFQRSSNPDFATILDETTARILVLANQLLRSASKGSDIAAPKMVDVDDVDNKWNDVVEVVDYVLEKAVCDSFSLSGAYECADGFLRKGYLFG